MTTQSNHNQPEPKKKMGKGRKAVAIVAGALLVFGVFAACNSEEEENTTSTVTAESQYETQNEAPANEPQESPEEDSDAQEEVQEEVQEEEIPREHRNALRSAESYLDFTSFSYQGLYDQLTSEYADSYSPDAAQYAVDNVDADWFQEAVESAESYLDFMPMSETELFNQLTSDYGDKFTSEQAQHAVDTVY